jgi:hypothetical protein
MSENLFFIGGGAGALGLLIGFLIGDTDEQEIAEEIGAYMNAGKETVEAASAEQMAQMAETVAALGAQVTGLEEQLAINAEQQAASDAATKDKLDAAVAALETKIGTVASDVGKMVSDSGAEQTAKIEAALAGGMADLQGSLETMAAAVPVATVAAAATGSAEETQPEPEPVVEIDGTKVGETELLMDGAVRVFVSGLDADAGTARVAVNGLGTQILGGWEKVTFSADGKDCLLQLDDIVEGHVQMSADCAE